MFTVQELQKRLGQADCASYFPNGHAERVAQFNAGSIRKMAENGIFAVEIGGYPRWNYDHLDEDYLQMLADAFTKYGVKPVSVHCPDLLRYPIENAAERSAAIAETERAARAAYRLGARLMVVHCIPGQDQHWVMRELIDRTFDLQGMRFTNENLPFDRIEDITEFIEKVDRINYGMTLDIGHVDVRKNPDKPASWDNAVNLFCIPGEARKIIDLCGKHLWHLHLHDFIDHDHYAPFTGNVCWTEVFEALEQTGYSGYFMFEAEHPDETTVLQNVGLVPKRLGREI